MVRRRWKLVGLWVVAVVLGVVAAGACMYSVARSAVERDAPKLFSGLGGVRYRSEVRLREVRFLEYSWLEFEFDVRFHPDDDSGSAGPFHWRWRLREWDAVLIFYE